VADRADRCVEVARGRAARRHPGNPRLRPKTLSTTFRLDRLACALSLQGECDACAAGVAGDGVVVLRVSHRPDAREECLIPDELLASMFTTAFRDVVRAVAGARNEHGRAA
jgi:hypothetical protein